MQYVGIISKDKDITGRHVVYVDLGDNQSVVFSFDHEPSDDEVASCANRHIIQTQKQEQIAVIQQNIKAILDIQQYIPTDYLSSDQTAFMQNTLDGLYQQLEALNNGN